jgi:hypothetical protein
MRQEIVEVRISQNHKYPSLEEQPQELPNQLLVLDRVRVVTMYEMGTLAL